MKDMKIEELLREHREWWSGDNKLEKLAMEIEQQILSLFAELEQEVKSLEESRNTYKVACDALMEKFDYYKKLEKKVEELEGENEKYKTAFSNLWNYYKELKKKRVDCNETISDKDDQIGDLISKIAAKDARIKELEAANKEWSELFLEAVKHNIFQAKQIASLTEQNKELEEKNSLLVEGMKESTKCFDYLFLEKCSLTEQVEQGKKAVELVEKVKEVFNGQVFYKGTEIDAIKRILSSWQNGGRE